MELKKIQSDANGKTPSTGQELVDAFNENVENTALKDLSNVENEKVMEMAGITKVAHEELPNGDYDSVIVLGTDDAADRGASIGITSQGEPFITTHHFLDTPIVDRKILALADLSNVESGTITPDMTTFADLPNSLKVIDATDLDTTTRSGTYIVHHYSRPGQIDNYAFLSVSTRLLITYQCMIGNNNVIEYRTQHGSNEWSDWETYNLSNIVNPQPAILPREFLSLTSSSTSEEILTTLNLAGGAEAIAALFQERKGSVFLDNDENGLHTLTDYRKVADNPWELYYSYFEYNVLVEISLYDDGTGTWHCTKNEYEIPKKQAKLLADSNGDLLTDSEGYCLTSN